MGDIANPSLMDSFDYQDMGTINLHNASGAQNSESGLRDAYTSPHLGRNRFTQ